MHRKCMKIYIVIYVYDFLKQEAKLGTYISSRAVVLSRGSQARSSRAGGRHRSKLRFQLDRQLSTIGRSLVATT